VTHLVAIGVTHDDLIGIAQQHRDVKPEHLNQVFSSSFLWTAAGRAERLGLQYRASDHLVDILTPRNLDANICIYTQKLGC
jgi:hypothetical protein